MAWIGTTFYLCNSHIHAYFCRYMSWFLVCSSSFMCAFYHLICHIYRPSYLWFARHYYTGCSFYRDPEHQSWLEMSRPMQVFYTIKRPCWVEHKGKTMCWTKRGSAQYPLWANFVRHPATSFTVSNIILNTSFPNTLRNFVISLFFYYNQLMHN